MTPTAAIRKRSSAISTTASVSPERKAIPFDYAFRYFLEGTPGKVQNSVVSISAEGSFTAVAISYGVVPEVQPVVFGAGSLSDGPSLTPTSIFNLSLGQVIQGLNDFLFENKIPLKKTGLRAETGTEAVFKNGVKLNPAVAEFALQGGTLSLDVLSRLFQVVGTPSDQIQFKYAIFDEGSGREFQSEPILNIAGLGSAAGERPFRHFAQPITFEPRSTIRLEITEISGFRGDLNVVLQGYKLLGYSGPTKTQRR
jgi:hypothetical protein